MTGSDFRRGLPGCQAAVLLALLLPVLPAAGADDGADRVRSAAQKLKRLERTCVGYAGPDARKLLDTMTFEAVRLYEREKYEEALDSILLAAAIYPKDVPRTYYGLTPLVRVTLRWPDKTEAALLPLDPKKYTWAMVALQNLSDVALDLKGIRAAVERDGRPVKDSAGKDVTSLLPDEHPELKELLGGRARALSPGKVEQGETVTYPVVFPAFERWTEIRLSAKSTGVNIEAAVKNYAAMAGHQRRLRHAVRRAAALRVEIAKATQPKQTDPPNKPPPPKPEYLLVGRIKNRMSAEWYGIKLELRLTKQYRRFYVREGENVAEMLPSRTGATAKLVRTGYKPKVGDRVYVRTAEKSRSTDPKS